MPSGRKTLTITNSIIRSFYRHIHYETYFDAGQRRDTNHANVGHKPTNRSDEAWDESPTDQQSTDKHTLRITGRQAGRRQEIDKNYYEIFINNLDTLGNDEDAECEKQDVIVGRFIDYLNENKIEYDFEEDILEVFEYINSYDTKEYIGDE